MRKVAPAVCVVVLGGFVIAPPPAALAAELVLHLKLDEGQGVSAIDSSGNSLDGLLHNMTEGDWVTGQSGQALDFDGIDDFVDVSDNALLSFGTKNFTISYWAYKQATSNGVFDNTYAVSKWGSGALPGTNEWALNIGNAPSAGNQTDKPHMIVEVGTTFYQAVSPNPISLLAWHHIAGVRNGQTLSLYVDGVLVAQDSTLPVGASVNDSARPLRLAANSPPTNLQVHTNAILDEIQIYDFAATEGQLTDLVANPGSVLDPPGLPATGVLTPLLGAALGGAALFAILGRRSRQRHRMSIKGKPD